MNDTTPTHEEEFLAFSRALAKAEDEVIELRKENDLLRATIGAQDVHSCEHDGCALSDEGREGYRAEARAWVRKYWIMRRRLIELGEPAP